ncbi:MAG: RsmB/NOP family class I SAM-dependent RNA methyltransferase [Phycisphaerales bacterium]|jgi:16S rRNA (cytosine1407-C5)-methyltransferase|nr:RsmB/NOP family class I SAM-dependent RNA methyltransferase [Phycisphaerales bacterium]
MPEGCCQNQEAVRCAEEALPQEFLERLRSILDEQSYESTLQSFANPKPIVFRVNTLRSTEKQVLGEIASGGFVVSPIPWCPLGYILEQGTIRGLQTLPCAQDGSIYIQSASSMAAANALEVQEGMSVLDMCAAPGSKTTQLAATMRNAGILIANDRSRKRLYRLREILQWQNATNVEVLCGEGERLGKTHADCFDRVLVDAPCSGEGRFRLDRPKRIQKWNVQAIRRLAKLQEQLLSTALRCVKVGGRVVYSTCTFAPEENECVLDRVLSKNSINAKVHALPRQCIPPSATAPLAEWNGNPFKNDVTDSMRIVPNQTTTGFFVAVLERQS